MGIIKKIKIALGVIWSGFDGWKSIIAYLLLQVPLFADNPWVIEAINKAINNPSAETIGYAVLQILLVLALAHKGVKEVADHNYPFVPTKN